MPDTLLVVLCALGLGFLVAILTGLTMSVEKMQELPGGSLGSGLAAAMAVTHDPLMWALGAGCGLAGWFCARLFFRAQKG